MPAAYREILPNLQRDFSQQVIQDVAASFVLLQPAKLASLRPHQWVGVHWLVQRLSSAETCPGALLCDGVGLGKTAQAIFTAAILRHVSPAAAPFSLVIITPVSLQSQWVAEMDAWLAHSLCWRSWSSLRSYDSVRRLAG